jgi:FkbM family methyltransferase
MSNIADIFILDSLRAGLRKDWSLEAAWPEIKPEQMAVVTAIQNALPSIHGSVHTTSGIKFQIDAAIPANITYLLLNSAYEFGDIDLVNKYVSQGDRCVMAGVGIGIVASALALASGNPVLGIDGNSRLEQFVDKTAELNGVEINFVHGVVGDFPESGTVPFSISREFWSSSLRDDTRLEHQTIQVPCLDLNVAVSAASANVLVIDIEGAEETLFAQYMISPAIKKLFVEIHSPNMATTTCARIKNELWAQGFRMIDTAGLMHYWERD